MGKFVGLHNHSEYSALDGFSSVEQMAKRTHDLNQSAGAICDHGDCGGHLVYQKAMIAEGVKPIFGMEGYLVDSVDRVRAEKDKVNSHIVLLAQNQTGLKNLWKLSTLGYTKGFYNKPNIDWEMLKDHSEGLYGTSACMLAFMARAILADDEEKCYDLIGKYLDVFDDRFYLEMHTWQFINPTSDKHFQMNADMAKINQGLLSLSRDLSIPLVVVNDAHYTIPEHSEHHELVWNMSTGYDADKTDDRGTTNGHMMDDDEVVFWMEKHGIPEKVTREAIDNTAYIGETCNVEIKGGNYIPTMTGSIESDEEIFDRQLAEGFQKKYVERYPDNPELVERARQRIWGLEIPAIKGKDFHPYFVITADFVRYAKSVGMLVGPGRGSGGGCAVAFCLGITELDPVLYDLPFERFMNPGRNSYPDFDIDFPKSRRKEIIAYIEAKYGKDKVCFIGNYSRRAPKMILKDLCRAMQIPFEDSSKMSKVIEKITDFMTPEGEEENEDDIDVEWDLILEDPALAQWASKYPELFQKIREMMGGIRGHGTHASGVIISTEPLADLIPLRTKGRKEDGKDVRILTTQFENKTSTPDNMEIEKFGFIKFDFLGLRHLDTLTEVNALVNGVGENGYPDPSFYYKFGQEQYSDPEHWSMVKRGETLGVFTVETPGMTKTGRGFNPLNEQDAADLISVNRPGLVRAGLLQEYLDRRSGLIPVRIRHPLLKDILSKTFGMFVYQEQIMYAVQALANYTLAEADNVRRIMGKKHQGELMALKPEFIERCLSNPAFTEAVPNPEQVAQKLWSDLEFFGSYGFNQAHALAYGMITGWGTYMKHYYPLEYWAACLKTDPGDGKPQQYLRAVRKMGKKVLPPDINESGPTFTLVDDGIRFGLISVRSVGPAAVKEIMSKRVSSPYSSFDDFCSRVTKLNVKYPAKENLVKIGSFDSLGEDRGTLLYELMKANKKDGEIPNFDSEKTLLEIEKALVGDFITKDPMLPFMEIWDEMSVPLDTIESLPVDSEVLIGGKINRLKPHKQRNEKEMMFMDFSNGSDEYSLPVFNTMLNTYRAYLEVDAPVLCKCVTSEYNGKRGLKLIELVRLDYL